MNQPLLTFAGVDVTLGAACLAFASAVLALLIAIAVLAARGSRRRLEDGRPPGAARRDDGGPDRRSRPHPGRDRRAGCRRWAKASAGGRPSLPGWWRSGSTRSPPGSATPWTRPRGRRWRGSKASTSASPCSTTPRRTSRSSRIRSSRCATCSATSRRAAPSARRAWRPSSRTRCRSRSMPSSTRCPTTPGRTA